MVPSLCKNVQHMYWKTKSNKIIHHELLFVYYH